MAPGADLPSRSSADREAISPGTMLEKALAMAPRLAKAHYFLGTALKTLGRYDEALDHLRLAAAGEGFQVMPYAEDVHEAELGD